MPSLPAPRPAWGSDRYTRTSFGALLASAKHDLGCSALAAGLGGGSVPKTRRGIRSSPFLDLGSTEPSSAYGGANSLPSRIGIHCDEEISVVCPPLSR
ncbi:hypothetical protein VTH06DRAFT_5153 [Thermothelomyces fergusii]